MPLPFPEVFVSGSHGHKDAPWKRLVCMQIAVLDWLTLGKPLKAPQSILLGKRLSSRQWSAVRMLEHLVRDGNTPEFIHAADMGRAAAKVENFERELGALCRAAFAVDGLERSYFSRDLTRSDDAVHADFLRCGQVVGEVGFSGMHGAKPLVASRLSFPADPSFDPRPFFCSETLKRYDSPLSDGLDPGEAEKPPPVQIRATQDNKLELLRKMARAGMLKVLEPGSFVSDFRSGLVAVHKNAEVDRMVLDGRPANLIDKPQTKWTLAMGSASSLADICIPPDRCLICSGEDLRDFFYQFAVNDERCARNVLAGSLSVEEAQYIFDGILTPELLRKHGSCIDVGLATLAMGDRNACEYAQCAHAGLCLQKNVCKADELIGLRSPIPRGLLHVGLVIDDLIVLEMLLRQDMAVEGWFGASESSARVEAARAAYAEVGQAHNPKKSFSGEVCSHFWGCEIDGDKGLLRCSSQRLWPTTLISLRTASLGLATVGLLEALAGCWVSLLGVRRRMYCLMNLIFEPLSIYEQPRSVVRLSDEMRSELCCLATLGSLAVVNLRAQYADFVCATDASCDYIAGVRGDIPVEVCRELSRHSVKKGNWSKLLPPGRAWLREHEMLHTDEELPGLTYTCHPLWQVISRSVEYKKAWCSRVDKKLHINVLELRAHLREEKFLSQSHSSLRVPFGLDSQVALGAVVKGRAASKALNVELQRTLAYPLGGDIYGLYMYFLSEFNRADDPTRGRDVGKPEWPLPPWWNSLACGDPSLFDEWIDAECRDFKPDVAPFHEICGHSDLNLETAARLKAACKKRRIKAQVKKLRCEVNAGGEWQNPGKPSLLSDEVVAALYSFNKNQYFFEPFFTHFDRPGALDLFSGSFGVAKHLVRCGAPFVLTFEWNRSESENLLYGPLRDKLIFLLKNGAFKCFGAAPICASFSVAITPPVRSRQFLRGRPNLSAAMRRKVKEGNSHNDFLADLIELVVAIGGIHFFCENPDGSWWWRQRRWLKFFNKEHPWIFRLCFCRFGTKWKKPTRVLTNTELGGLCLWCVCKGKHVQLRGNDPVRKMPMTRVAQPYPRGLSRLLALALARSSGWSKGGKLNVAACAHTGTLRVGEAANPGPRRWRAREGNLENLPLQTARTLEMESKLLQEFLTWCNQCLSVVDATEFFSTVPTALPHVLRAYGNYLYKHGGALSNYRHVLLAGQKWQPLSKPFMSTAWELVERWEAITPVKHRTPVPEILMQAMCCLAWHLGWKVWVCATLLSFYGAGRLGEVLRCNREDLLLPEDLLQNEGDPIFLRLRSFKSQFRQPAKVQHMKITHSVACKLISRVFRRLRYDEPLFSAGPYQYRQRWDILLSLLGLRGIVDLTPGGLRAGAAVYHYRNGKSIGDLLWLMRLRSQSTLESYLQEVAALNSFARLSASKRHSILLVAETFNFLASGAV